MCQPGRPGPGADVPRRLARLRRLPQHEVAGIVLGVFVDVHARAGVQAVVIETRQPAVVGQRGDLEVDRSVAAVGVAVALEREDHLAHRAQVRLVGRARHLLRRLDARAALGVVPEARDPLLRVVAQRHAGLLRAGNRLVVDVGVVDDLVHS